MGVNEVRFKINYKLAKTHICNKRICIQQPFILVQDLGEGMVLGMPFLNTIYAITRVDNQGVRIELPNQEILFEFSYKKNQD